MGNYPEFENRCSNACIRQVKKVVFKYNSIMSWNYMYQPFLRGIACNLWLWRMRKIRSADNDIHYWLCVSVTNSFETLPEYLEDTASRPDNYFINLKSVIGIVRLMIVQHLVRIWWRWTGRSFKSVNVSVFCIVHLGKHILIIMNFYVFNWNP